MSNLPSICLHISVVYNETFDRTLSHFHGVNLVCFFQLSACVDPFGDLNHQGGYKQSNIQIYPDRFKKIIDLEGCRAR